MVKTSLRSNAGDFLRVFFELMVVALVLFGLAGRVHAEGENAKYKVVSMRVTAYCPCEKCCGEYADGVTANGYVIKEGDTFVAASRDYAFGTKMVIEGYSNSEAVKVKDRGGAIYDNRLDVFFATHQEALEWGVQFIDVQIFE